MTRCTLLLVVLHLLPQPARAQTAAHAITSWFDQKTMTGDWGGWRDGLAADGIVPHAGYVGDMAGNPVGGRSRGVAYAHQFELGADLDLAKLAGGDFGTLPFSLTERAGSGLSARRIGDLEEAQEIFGSGETVRLPRLAVRRAFGQRFEAGVGWSDTEEDFAASSIYRGKALYCSYQNLSFCGKPPTLGLNSGYSFIPKAVASGWIKFHPAVDHAFVVAVGADAVDPTVPNAHDGFKLGVRDDTGALLPNELGYHRGDTNEHGALLGTYRMSAYLDTSRVADVVGQVRGFSPRDVPLHGLPMQAGSGRYGGRVPADQMIARDAFDFQRGVVALVFAYGNPWTAIIPYFGSMGLARHGRLASRPDDIIAAGFYVAAVNPRIARYKRLLADSGFLVPRQSQEMRARSATPFNDGWLTVRPGTQYELHPSGKKKSGMPSC